jgi:hypothetical protein
MKNSPSECPEAPIDDESLYDLVNDDELWVQDDVPANYFVPDLPLLREQIRWFMDELNRRDDQFMKVMDERDAARQEVERLQKQNQMMLDDLGALRAIVREWMHQEPPVTKSGVDQDADRPFEDAGHD